MNIRQEKITTDWTLYTLNNGHDMQVEVLNFGGIITKIIVPDRNGLKENVVIGYKNYLDYNANENYFGALIGRVAGRIQGATFQVNGHGYVLEQNEGNNHLHGGNHGFHQAIFDVEPFQKEDTVGLKLSYNSKDGDGGYPGNVKVVVTYSLNKENQFIIDYWATTDKATPLTLTNHTYFNLTGNLKGTVKDHYVTIASHEFVELDNHLIPTGKVLEVENTPFDFRSESPITKGMDSIFEQNVLVGNGYDHYFIFDEHKNEHVRMKDKSSGRELLISTNQPGMVMYTSNNLGEGMDPNGGVSSKYLGVCFETQGSPASLHHTGFPSIILKENEVYEKQTVFTFRVSD